MSLNQNQNLSMSMSMSMSMSAARTAPPLPNSNDARKRAAPYSARCCSAGAAGMPAMQDTISALLQQVSNKTPGALDALFSSAYPELRKLARSRLRDGGRNTVLDTTALVHESYLHFVNGGNLRSHERRAFFAYASQVMRAVIIDTVRERQAQRRGGDLQRMTLDTACADQLPAGENELLNVHDALNLLAQAEPRLAQVVEMRYFGGYTEAEIGDALEVTERTVRRDWDKARLLLRALLQD